MRSKKTIARTPRQTHSDVDSTNRVRLRNIAIKGQAAGSPSLIDKTLDRLARALELALALAFIAAVLLNFTNVVGRYLFGLSLLAADEIQVFVMVAMTFLGAVVVTRRNQHLRMDVLVQFMPAELRLALRIIEPLLLALLAGFVLWQSWFYASQMLRIGRRSDMAGMPMWIPHGVVALGFGLILIVALWRMAAMARRTPEPAERAKSQP
jgi:TRAP-type C4-dicarboxylate transport system permease small subunit